jgi:hypothetical protein
MDDILEKLTINIDSNYAEFKDKTEFYVDMIEDIKNCVYIKTLKTEVYVSSTTPQYTVPSITNVSLNTLSSNNYNIASDESIRHEYDKVLRAQNYEKDNFINKNFNNIPFLDFGNYIYVTLNDFYRIRSVSKTNIRKHDPKTFNSLSSSTNNNYTKWKKVDLLAVETFQITDDPSTIDYSNVNTTNLVHNGLYREETISYSFPQRQIQFDVVNTFDKDIYNINNWKTILTHFLKQRFFEYNGKYYIISDLSTVTADYIDMTEIVGFPQSGHYVDPSGDFIIHNLGFYLNLSYENSAISFTTASDSGNTLTLNISINDIETIRNNYSNVISTTNLNTLINKFTDKDEVNLDDVDMNVIDGMTYNGGTPDPLQYYFHYIKGTKLYKTDIYFYDNLGTTQNKNYCKFVPTEEELGICYRNYKINRHTFENSPILDKSIDYIFKEKQINKDYAFTNYIGSYDNNIEYENTETETETAILNYYDSIYINKTTHDFMGVNDNYITVYKHELSGTSCGPNDTNTKILNPLLPELRKFSVKLWRVDSDGSHVPIEINKNGTEGVIRVVMSFTIYYKRKKVTMV